MGRKIYRNTKRKSKVSNRRNTNRRNTKRKNKVSKRRNTNRKNKVYKRRNRLLKRGGGDDNQTLNIGNVGDTIILPTGVKAVINDVVTDTRDSSKIMYDVSWHPEGAPEATYTAFVYASDVN
tara:strand:- start:88 stop:453 length:366 start_codon:yes stop_codon:yes gene_type:complete